MARTLFRNRRYVVATVAVGALGCLSACHADTGGTPSTVPTATNVMSDTLGQYGFLPAAQGPPTSGGTVTYGIINGSTPTWIFPLTPDADSDVVNSTFQTPMFVPLLSNEDSDRPVLSYPDSIINKPIYSHGDKTVTLNLKHSYTWSDGQPVDAADVVFYLDILRAAIKENADNVGFFTPGEIPANVTSVATPNKFTVVLNLDRAYNPNWFTNTQLVDITPFPSTSWAKTSANGKQVDYSNPANAKAIFDFLTSQAKDKPTFATNPLWQDVDGPFRISSYTPSTGENTMIANTKYTGPNKPHIAKLQAVYFASSTAEVNQLRAGTLDIGYIDPSDIPQAKTIEANGYHVWGYPSVGFQYLVFNFLDDTDGWNKIISQLYVRQALAHLQDQAAIIKGVYDGTADPAYSTIPPVPKTPYTPSSVETNPYPFSIADASKLLSSHGWHVVPNGTTTCQNPGTGATQCGAGIAKGANLNFTCYYSSDPASIGAQVTSVASEAKRVGINITPVSKTFDFLINQYDDPVTKSQDDHWAAEDYGGFTLGDYPTADTIFNTGGDDNEGGWSNAEADKLIDASKFSSNPSALKAEATYIGKELPAIFQPNPDTIIAWHDVTGPADSFANLTQYGFNPQFWWVPKS